MEPCLIRIIGDALHFCKKYTEPGGGIGENSPVRQDVAGSRSPRMDVERPLHTPFAAAGRSGRMTKGNDQCARSIEHRQRSRGGSYDSAVSVNFDSCPVHVVL